MKKGLLIIYAFVVFLFLEISITFILNTKVIHDYNRTVYNENLSNNLISFTLFEKYISYYNYGNILYKNQKYSEARIQYEKALVRNVPKNKVCDIRINLVLTIIKDIDTFNMTVEKQLATLQEARKLLYEDSCANIDNDLGNSQKAEDLEQKIKDLEKSLGSSSDTKDEPENKNEDEKENDIEEQKKEELEERNSTSTQSRQEELQNYETLDDYHYYNGKTW
ncbi:MAG: tetratricopeptide repeat protein [Bacilli bacterium]|nr:tetratricopeptide repeat protein [Bacilli bacterium]